MTQPSGRLHRAGGLRLTLSLEHLSTELVILHTHRMDFQYFSSKRMSPDCHGSDFYVLLFLLIISHSGQCETVCVSRASILWCLNSFECSTQSCEYPCLYTSSSHPIVFSKPCTKALLRQQVVLRQEHNAFEEIV